MTDTRAELITDWVDRWYRRGCILPLPQRRYALTALAQASPLLRFWRHWERLFEPLFLIAIGFQSAGALAMAIDGPPMLSGGLVLIGEIIGAVLVTRLWLVAKQALDITAGRLIGHFY